MDRSVLRRHLERAKEQVAQGQRLIERQRQLVAELERDGHPSETAKTILAAFENLQTMHLENRQQILAEIADSKPRGR